MTDIETPIVDLIRRLLSHGLSRDIALEEGAKLEAQMARNAVSSRDGAAYREVERIRKQRQRERKAASVPGHDVAALYSNNNNSKILGKREIAATDLVPGQTPAPKASRPARDNGSRLPDNWSPDEDLFAYGEGLGLSRQETAEKCEEIKLWAIANANRAVARKSNWASTFKGALRRDAARIIRNRRGGNGNATDRNNSPRGFSGIAARVRRGIEERGEGFDFAPRGSEPFDRR